MRAREWLAAARPQTLAASLAPVLGGTAVAASENGMQVDKAAAALIVAVALQVGVNYANDYFDFRHGVDTEERVGPRRLAASGLVPPEYLRNAALGALAVAALVGLVLSLTVDWRLIVVGAAAVAAAWFYAAGPWPYGHRGLGELFVFIFFGLVATCGTAYVQEREVTPLAFALGLAMGCLSSAILAVNNLRDLETDAKSGKRTLAVRLGPDRGGAFLIGLLVAAFEVPVLVFVLNLGTFFTLLAELSIPIAFVVVRSASRRDRAQMIGALQAAAALQLIYTGLFAVGLALGGL